jgi:AcrR family transcriptional regulator
MFYDCAMKTPKLNKHQLQSEATRAALLQAARKIFVRDGFERAQIDDIAAEAGRTRGAVYTHFESKEDLFLSLLEHQMQGTRSRATDFIASQSEESPELRLKALKKFYSEADDPEWSILALEFKLFGLRNPNSMAQLRDLYRRTYIFDGFAERYGVKEEPGRPKVKSRLFALNAIGSAMMLDTHFEPDALSSKEVKLILGETFECLFPSGQSAAEPPKTFSRSRKNRKPSSAK